MLLGRVIGNVWATRKDRRMEGFKLLLVGRETPAGDALDDFVVAVDTVDAGVGDRVLVAQGSSARQTDETENRPVDAVIMAVVDGVEAGP